MEENKKVTKIVVASSDELTDIANAIVEANNERVILTFAEETDILISPINLKVLLEIADENKKILISQIIKNPTGIRNSSIAGIPIIDTPNNPADEDWENAKRLADRRLNPMKELRKKEPLEEPLPQPSSFEKRVNEALRKSREEKVEIREEEEKEEFISFDKDLPTQEKQNTQPDLSKIDFKNIKKEIPEQTRTNTPRFSLKNLFQKKDPNAVQTKGVIPGKVKRLLVIIFIALFFVGGIAAFAYYKTAPFVRLKIFITAKEVSLEKIFAGDENIKEVDFTNLKIPVKGETVEKSRSAGVTATGKAYKGNKATGSVTITYAKPDGCTGVVAKNLPAGQILVSSGGKNFILDAAASVECNKSTDVAVRAVEVGEEYNLPSGNFFTVQGYSSNEIFALNNSGAFTGGSKQEYTVLSQVDVDKAVEELKTTAIAEGEQELKDKVGTWEIILDSLKSEIVKDSVKTDVAVGTEVNTANVSLKTTSTASYFFKEGFDEGISAMLTAEAQAKNLFENEDNLKLTLGDNIQKDISVAENNKNGIKIKLVVSGSVKPEVDKDQIIKDLSGKSWKDGIQYVEALSFAAKPTQVDFNPKAIPENLWYFPDKQGGILLTIEEIQ